MEECAQFRELYTNAVDGIVVARRLINTSRDYGLNGYPLATAIYAAEIKLQQIHPDCGDTPVPSDDQIAIILKDNPRVYTELLLAFQRFAAELKTLADHVRVYLRMTGVAR